MSREMEVRAPVDDMTGPQQPDCFISCTFRSHDYNHTTHHTRCASKHCTFLNTPHTMASLAAPSDHTTTTTRHITQGGPVNTGPSSIHHTQWPH